MENLKYHEVTFKASHNSYDRNENLDDQLKFNPKAPHDCGCRGLELDIWRHSDKSGEKYHEYFTVSHFTNGGDPLSSYLDLLKKWHADNPNHDVILVHLDIKSSNGGCSKFQQELDDYLKMYLDASLIFKPENLTPDANNLFGYVVKNGWPTLGELKGKFIFCLSGNEEWKDKYAEVNHRLCFSDAKGNKDANPTDINNNKTPKNRFVFFNFSKVCDMTKFNKENIISRVYDVNSEGDWNECIKNGVSVIATNKVSGHKWCKVDDEKLFIEK